jgi:hypothetical protein
VLNGTDVSVAPSTGDDHDLVRPDVGAAFERVRAFLRGHAAAR